MKLFFVWAYNNDGKYTVKSGNWLQNQAAVNPYAESDNSRKTKELKSKVWTLKTMPKIKLFLWRALSNALAVSECLLSHCLQTNPICRICQGEEETISHVLFGCTLAVRTWSASGFTLPPSGFSSVIGENFDHMMDLMNNFGIPTERRESIPWILWGIWKARNACLFARQQGDPHVLLAQALADSDEWLQQQSLRSYVPVPASSCRQRLSRSWTKPSFGILKCNVYASWINESSFCGGAWIVRDYTGSAIFHARDAFLPTSNRISAELQCIKWTIRSLNDLQVTNVEVWSDCNAAISALLEPDKWPKYRSLVSQIRQSLQAVGSCKFYVSDTKANRLATDIAKSVTRDGRFNSYLATGGPAWLHNRIEEERRR